ITPALLVYSIPIALGCLQLATTQEVKFAAGLFGIVGSLVGFAVVAPLHEWLDRAFAVFESYIWGSRFATVVAVAMCCVLCGCLLVLPVCWGILTVVVSWPGVAGWYAAGVSIAAIIRFKVVDGTRVDISSPQQLRVPFVSSLLLLA